MGAELQTVPNRQKIQDILRMDKPMDNECFDMAILYSGIRPHHTDGRDRCALHESAFLCKLL